MRALRTLVLGALLLGTSASGCSCEGEPGVTTREDAGPRDAGPTWRTCDEARMGPGQDGDLCEGSFFCSAGGVGACDCTTFYECVRGRLGVTTTCPCD